MFCSLAIGIMSVQCQTLCNTSLSILPSGSIDVMLYENLTINCTTDYPCPHEKGRDESVSIVGIPLLIVTQARLQRYNNTEQKCVYPFTVPFTQNSTLNCTLLSHGNLCHSNEQLFVHVTSPPPQIIVANISQLMEIYVCKVPSSYQIVQWYRNYDDNGILQNITEKQTITLSKSNDFQFLTLTLNKSSGCSFDNIHQVICSTRVEKDSTRYYSTPINRTISITTTPLPTTISTPVPSISTSVPSPTCKLYTAHALATYYRTCSSYSDNLLVFMLRIFLFFCRWHNTYKLSN